MHICKLLSDVLNERQCSCIIAPKVIDVFNPYSKIPTHARKLATSEEMRELDRRAEQEFGVPSIVLMENAGRGVYEAVAHLIGNVQGKHVAVVAGRGNNGGDGFVAARHLRDAGAQVKVLLLANPSEVTGDARINLDILLKTGLPVQPISVSDNLTAELAHCDVIIDSIFGTGIRGEVTGLPAEAIRAINSSNRPVVSVDIPSGLDANTGRILGNCVQAHCTVTFALPKIGLVTYPGATCVGKLTVQDIGIPHSLYETISVELSSEKWVASKLPNRPPDAHKGSFGTTIVIGGSSGMIGAAVLAGESALRCGTGLSITAVPASLQDVAAAKLTEVMTRPLPETETRAISSNALEPALQLCEKASAVVLGCGIGTHESTREFVVTLLSSLEKPLLLDADALNCLAVDPTALENKHGPVVITPHPGEMARLLKTNTQEIQADRLATARLASSRFHSVVVLKGARTIIAEPSGRVFVNPTGNHGMATGGTGDVLAGAIGSLMAQGLSPLEAAICGAFIHGMAGDLSAHELGDAGMMAGDVLKALPKAMKALYHIKIEEVKP